MLDEERPARVDRSRCGVGYAHPDFPPGTRVYVLEAVREYAPDHPCAGQIVEATARLYWPMIDCIECIDHTEMVPVRHLRHIYSVPARYIRLAETGECKKHVADGDGR